MVAVAVTFAPPAGHDFVTLSGTIETDAAFATQPIAGDQIVYPSALTCDAQLNISGPVGTHTLWHMRQSGVAVATEYEIVNLSAPVLSGATFNQITSGSLRFQVQTDKSDGTWYVLIGTSMPADGDVISTGVSAAVSAAGVLSHTFSSLDPSTLYYAKAVHVDADTNVSNYATTSQSTYASGSISVPVVFSPPDGFTVATLEAGYNTQTLQQWPEVIADEDLTGWQLVSETALGYFDSMGNFYFDVEGVLDYWAISPAGVAYHHTIDTTGLSSAVPLDLENQSVTDTEINTWTEMPEQVVLSIDSATSAISSIDNSQAQQRVSTDDGETFDEWSSTQRTGLSTGTIIELRIMSGPDYSNTGSDYSRSAQVTINGVSFTISATNRAAVVPVITAQPQNDTVQVGQTASFSVTATSAASYQWKRNGTNISGATGNTVDIDTTGFAIGDSTITVDTISSEGGITTSDNATLTVTAVATTFTSAEPLVDINTGSVLANTEIDYILITVAGVEVPGTATADGDGYLSDSSVEFGASDDVVRVIVENAGSAYISGFTVTLT